MLSELFGRKISFGAFTFGFSILTFAKPIPHENPKTFLRLKFAMNHLKMAPDGEHLAFFEERAHQNPHLFVLSLKDQAVYSVPGDLISQGFAFVPGGRRMIYTTYKLDAEKIVGSSINFYDLIQHKSYVLADYDHPIGYPNIDPRDLRLRVAAPSGAFHVLKLKFPSSRLAKWQSENWARGGSWLASKYSILWMSEDGKTLHEVFSASSGIDSYDLSADGERIAFATKDAKLYVAKKGGKAEFVAGGKDPSWHPRYALLAFAGARYVGQKVIDYDLAVREDTGKLTWLTFTPETSERWPVWKKLGLIYTKEKTSDFFFLGNEDARFAQNPPSYDSFHEHWPKSY